MSSFRWLESTGFQIRVVTFFQVSTEADVSVFADICNLTGFLINGSMLSSFGSSKAMAIWVTSVVLPLPSFL